MEFGVQINHLKIPENIELIKDVFDECFEEYFNCWASNCKRNQKYDWTIFVAQVKKTVVGFIVASKEFAHDEDDDDDDQSYHINYIGVSEEFRRMGIGRELIRCLHKSKKRLTAVAVSELGNKFFKNIEFMKNVKMDFLMPDTFVYSTT